MRLRDRRILIAAPERRAAKDFTARQPMCRPAKAEGLTPVAADPLSGQTAPRNRGVTI